MQELAQYLLQRSDDVTSNKTKQTFLNVVKSCYYAISCPPYMVDRHVSKVIFERVIWNKVLCVHTENAIKSGRGKVYKQ